MGSDITLSSHSRVWTVENGVGPFNQPLYQGCAKIGDSSWSFGDVEPVECPDPERYGGFVKVGEIQGQIERTTTSLNGRYPSELSELLRLGRKRCRLDVQVHLGKCRDPQDFSEGWEKVKIYPKGRISSWGDENAGALSSDENEVTNETVELSADELYEVKRLAFEEQATTDVVREIISIDVCDAINCGDCGEPSDGCEKVFATMVGVGSTPGTLPSVVFSEDGGTTWDTTNIDTLFANEAPSDSECVNGLFVVVSNGSNSLHYAPTSDILDATENWVEVTSGFVAGGEPNAIWAADSRHVWIAGDGGYIYFSSDVRSGVTVQNPGVATTQDLVDVHAFDDQFVVAVGNLNTVVYTENGGATWNAVTGPAIGVGLTSVWAHGSKTWIVGDANGALWKTRNSGQSWTQYTNLPIALVRVDEIAFANDTIGYLAARDGAAHGVILRTIDGGYSWYVLPEGPGGISIPDNDRINQLAVCPDNVNVVFGGGLGGNATDGIIVKAA